MKNYPGKPQVLKRAKGLVQNSCSWNEALSLLCRWALEDLEETNLFLQSVVPRFIVKVPSVQGNGNPQPISVTWFICSLLTEGKMDFWP